MYTKTIIFAFVAVCVAACLADPEAKPEPKAWYGGCDPCTVHRCHTFPIHSAVGIKTTHRIIPSNTCGLGYGYGGLGGWGGYGYGGLGGWGGYGYGGLGGWGGCGYGGLGGWGGYGYGLGCGCGY